MSWKTFFIVPLYSLAHIAFIAPFVPAANILPAGFGALSMTSMALALVLAARWPIVDRVMGGPDQSYYIHRWLGFLGFTGALGHWAMALSRHWQKAVSTLVTLPFTA